MKSAAKTVQAGILATALSLSGGAVFADQFGAVGEKPDPSVLERITVTMFPGFRDDHSGGAASRLQSRRQSQPAFAEELRRQERDINHTGTNRFESERNTTVGNVLKLDF